MFVASEGNRWKDWPLLPPYLMFVIVSILHGVMTVVCISYGLMPLAAASLVYSAVGFAVAPFIYRHHKRVSTADSYQEEILPILSGDDAEKFVIRNADGSCVYSAF